ncbi:lipid II:glycine glycyltransferase FemX [Nitrospira sp. Nam80]
MPIRLFQTNEEYASWDHYVSEVPGAHYFQTYGWLKSYEPMGFTPHVLAYEVDGAIQGGVAFMSAKVPFAPWRIFILSHGPLPIDPHRPSWMSLMQRVDQLCRERRAISITVYPHELANQTTLFRRFEELGFTTSTMLTSHRFSSTPVTVDLTNKTEAELLMSFRPRTRQYIRKGLSGDLVIRTEVDGRTFDAIYALLVEHGNLKGYHPRPYSSVKTAWEWFAPRGGACLYQAWRNECLAGAILVIFTGCTAYYITGAVRREYSEHRPAELLHWRAIRDAMARGINAYDFTSMGDAGGSQFKAGFRPLCQSWQRPRTKVYRPVMAHLMGMTDAYCRPFIRWLARYRANAGPHPQTGRLNDPLPQGREL